MYSSISRDTTTIRLCSHNMDTVCNQTFSPANAVIFVTQITHNKINQLRRSRVLKNIIHFFQSNTAIPTFNIIKKYLVNVLGYTMKIVV